MAANRFTMNWRCDPNCSKVSIVDSLGDLLDGSDFLESVTKDKLCMTRYFSRWIELVSNEAEDVGRVGGAFVTENGGNFLARQININ